MLSKIQKTVAQLLLINLFICSAFVYAQIPFVNMQNNMRIDEKTGVPAAIYNVQSKQYNGTPAQIARQYLEENSALLKMEKNLEDLELIKVTKSPAGFHVSFRQVYQSIPVMRSDMVISINHQNRVTMVINGHKPDISVNTTPSISKTQALELARPSVGAQRTEDIFPPRLDLMVYEDSTYMFHLIWKTHVSPSDEEAE